MKNYNQEPTNEEISVRAYYLWEAAGRPIGRDCEYWNKAKEEMLMRQKETAKPVTPLKTISNEQPGTNGSATKSPSKKKSANSRTPLYA